MITLRRASKGVDVVGRRHVVLDQVNARLPQGRSIGVLSSGSDASLLLRLLAGADHLDEGSLRVDASVSWPLGRRGNYFGTMTPRDAATFVARLYGDDPRRVVAFMRNFSGVGRSIDDSLKRCTSDMKSRVQLSLALSIQFDCFLIDGTTLSANQEFQQKCWDVLDERRRNGASLIIASRAVRPILDHCDMVVVLANGALMIYDDVREGVRHYREALPVRDTLRAANVEGPRP